MHPNHSQAGPDPASQRLRVKAASASIAVALLLAGVKFWAWAETGSAAILSDALETIINIVAGSFALVSVLVSAAPPDPRHPYGHGKIEYFSAGFEGSLIVLAAVLIGMEGVEKIIEPQPLPSLGFGTLLVAGAGVVNLILGLTLVRVGRATNSLTLTADGRHVLTDVWTSLGVVGGLVLVMFTGWTVLDGILALGVAVHILFTGISLMRQSFGGLMDETDPELLEEICGVLNDSRAPEVIGIHRLRALRAGERIIVDFHATLPRTLSFQKAHELVTQMEKTLIDHYGGMADVVAHADPCEDPDCGRCTTDECTLRTADGAEEKLAPDTAVLNRSDPGSDSDIPAKRG